MEKKERIVQPKSFKFHKVSSYMFTYPIERVNSIIRDRILERDLVNNLSLNSSWYKDSFLLSMYEESCIFRYKFNGSDLPRRCINGYDTILPVFLDYLKVSKGNKRIDKLKAKITVKTFVRNLSRVDYHRRRSLTYVRHKSYWTDFKNLSHTYMMDLIDMMEDMSYIINYKGFKGKDDKSVKSMILVSQDLVDLCTDKLTESEPEKLLPPKEETIVIKINKYNSRQPTSREKREVNKLAKVVDAYNEQLSKRSITINGYEIPELFFRRVFMEDLETCGRYYDSGDGIQRKSKEERATTLIDGEEVVSLDFKSLHPCLAAELLGKRLDYDPYKCSIEIPIDNSIVEGYKEELGLPKYDPVRNLCKKALLTMINSQNPLEASRSLSKALKDDMKKPLNKRMFVGITKGVPVGKLIENLSEVNSMIKEFLCSRKGNYFQYLDSQIMDYCIQKHIDIDEVIIPIHDCCMVKKSLKEFTLSTMIDGYKYVMGSTLNCTIEEE